MYAVQKEGNNKK